MPIMMIMMRDAANVWGAFGWDWCLFEDGLLGKHIYFDRFFVCYEIQFQVQGRAG